MLPALGHTYRAKRGDGATYDGRPIRVLEAMPVADLATFYSGSQIHKDYRLRFPGKVRSLGSTAFHYLLVARGAGVGALSGAHIWDYAAAAAILTEAGGVLRHLDGEEIRWPAWLDGKHLSPPVLGAPACFWEQLASVIVPV